MLQEPSITVSLNCFYDIFLFSMLIYFEEEKIFVLAVYTLTQHQLNGDVFVDLMKRVCCVDTILYYSDNIMYVSRVHGNGIGPSHGLWRCGSQSEMCDFGTRIHRPENVN